MKDSYRLNGVKLSCDGWSSGGQDASCWTKSRRTIVDGIKTQPLHSRPWCSIFPLPPVELELKLVIRACPVNCSFAKQVEPTLHLSMMKFQTKLIPNKKVGVGTSVPMNFSPSWMLLLIWKPMWWNLSSQICRVVTANPMGMGRGRGGMTFSYFSTKHRLRFADYKRQWSDSMALA